MSGKQKLQIAAPKSTIVAVSCTKNLFPPGQFHIGECFFDLVAGDDHQLPCRIGFLHGRICLFRSGICHTSGFSYQFLCFSKLFWKYSDQSLSIASIYEEITKTNMGQECPYGSWGSQPSVSGFRSSFPFWFWLLILNSCHFSTPEIPADTSPSHGPSCTSPLNPTPL